MVVGTIEFEFPLPRVHTGVHLGNGRMGVLVWGDENLHLTFAINGFWDRRGRRELGSPMNFQELKAALLGGREGEVRSAFGANQLPLQQLGGGRLTLRFGEKPLSASLNLQTGELTIRLASHKVVNITLGMDQEILAIHLPPETTVISTELQPCWHWLAKSLLELGYQPPTEESNSDQTDTHWSSFIQESPEDGRLQALAVTRPGLISLCVNLGQETTEEMLTKCRTITYLAVTQQSEADWSEYWNRIPSIAYPDALIQEAVVYGLWKQHGIAHPLGTPATLQGPWMEEHRIPLWSNDYHFNINLQMMYMPCLELRLSDHLLPLWKMIHSWIPKLQTFGEAFFGARGAVMLPHAVDDKGHPIGSYWQGTIDHVSTTWISLMLWRDAQGTNDEWLLQEVAWPMLLGSFIGFRAMLEFDGSDFSLPVSVSPEYGEGAVGTWGKNSSFALAAIHRLCKELPLAAERLGKPIDPEWELISRRLPKFSKIECGKGPYDDPNAEPCFRVSLWEGQDLAYSHRHHSHLAGIYPFDVYETEESDSEESKVILESLMHWTSMGGGQWCSWSTLWAVCILARMGWHEAAECWLRFMVQGSINEGKSLSAASSRGIHHGWGSAQHGRKYMKDGDHEVMQHDANMGIISAALEVIRAKQRAKAGPEWDQSLTEPVLLGL